MSLHLELAEKVEATIRVGESVDVQVDDIATTGYRWEVAGVDPSVVSSEDGGLAPGHADASPGAAGTRRFVFTGIAPGRSLIRLTLRRPWEPEGAAIRRGSIDLTVRPGDA